VAPKDEAEVLAAEMTIGARLNLPGPVLPSGTVSDDVPPSLLSTCLSSTQVAAMPPKGLAGVEWVMVACDNLMSRPLAPA